MTAPSSGGNAPHGGDLLGQLAVARGVITPEQLRHALEILGRPDNRARLGDILVEEGFVSAAEMQALVAEQTAMLAARSVPAPAASAEDALLLVQGAELTSAAPSPTPVARVNVARKSAAQVEAERGAAKRPAAKPPKARAARGEPEDRGIELDLADDDGAFEIETTDGARKVATAASAPAAPSADAPSSDPAPGDGAAASGALPDANARAEAVLATAGGKMVAELVVAAARATASDLHLHAGHPLMIRQHGRLVAGQGAPLAAAQLQSALVDLLDPAERRAWERDGQVEALFLVPNVARCRVQMFQGAEGPSAVFRLLPLIIPTLSTLALPTTLARYVAGSQGLVVIAGPSGAGKTWTMAALVDILNTERREHIVCVERPIEFLHPSKRCVVSQREVPTHASSMSRAVRAALAEDPDVIVIGEVEDVETARLAVTAAESGRLVLTTVAATGTVRAITRLLGMFPADQQAQGAAMLADALRAVVAQRMVPMADGVRRLPVCEILEVDAAAAGKIHAGVPYELQPTTPFDQALAAAVRSGAVTREEARRHADRPEPFA